MVKIYKENNDRLNERIVKLVVKVSCLDNQNTQVIYIYIIYHVYMHYVRMSFDYSLLLYLVNG